MTISGSSAMRITRRAALFGLAAIAGLGPVQAFAGDRVRLSGRAFGTTWSVIARDTGDPQVLAEKIRAMLAGIDAEMSPFRPNSALTRFNTDAPELRVSGDFTTVARAALDMALISDGAFDPTVGPAVARYGFGPIRGRAGSSNGNWRRIACGDGRLSRQGNVTLDLCGIAKGFAVDRLAELVGAASAAFIVEIGGEIRAQGDWPVGIADPDKGGVHSRIRLGSAAVATSGDAVNRYDIGGRRYSHTIDPATGEPVPGDIASVSVIAESAMRADALATALLVMGEKRGLAFADSQSVGALYLIRDNGALRPGFNAGFAAHLI